MYCTNIKICFNSIKGDEGLERATIETLRIIGHPPSNLRVDLHEISWISNPVGWSMIFQNKSRSINLHVNFDDIDPTEESKFSLTPNLRKTIYNFGLP